MTTRRSRSTDSAVPDDGDEPGAPLWYKDAIIYQTRVGAFQDSDDDGVGDFRGLTQRLDYIQDLGVTAIWLLPFCPSPGRDDGYDIADYTGVHPAYGTLDDFKVFLKESHRRGLRVITELVINHTSDQHPWFQRARRSPPGSRWRNYYVWSDTPEKFTEARIIFKDFEPSNWSWDPEARAYYWHRFYSHQPDLNFESPDVRKAVLRFLDFWFKLGVDGLRLDAIPYLFEREGTNCENLPETHAFLKDLRRHVDAHFRDRMLLAEANQWPEDAVAYFGDGDECHMAFHFPVMPRLFMAVHMEDRFPVVDILDQTPAIPESCQWAMFLRNHDELTLEMVTDEERDYMYAVYAKDTRARINLGIRRRLAPLLGNNRRRIELMNALLCSLPGTPVIYYGDEIGMGDNIYLGDRNGVRTPMQWSPDRNAGFSRANPQQLHLPVIVDPEYHYEALNVETQQRSGYSLLSWTKRLLALRKRYRAFGRGSLEFLHPSNHKVLAFIRAYEDVRILVVVNLSRFVEYVELDLGAHQGSTPVELFGGRPLPPIGELPYLLTLGPHSFYWLRLDAPESRDDEPGAEAPARPVLRVRGAWQSLLRDPDRERLEAALPAMVRGRRWFGGKAESIESVEVIDTLRLGTNAGTPLLALVRFTQERGAATYALPLAFVEGARAAELQHEHPETVLADVEVETDRGLQRGILIDAIATDELQQQLLETIGRQRRLRGDRGQVRGSRTAELRKLRGPEDEPLPARLLRVEQSNSSLIYGDRLVLKLFRRLGEGVNPDVEIGTFLTERAHFPHTPAVAGSLEYRVGREEPITLGILQAFVPSEGDAWRFTVHQVEQSLEQVLARPDARAPAQLPAMLALSEEPAPGEAGEIVGGYLESARLLGQRTAELHLALACDRADPAFAPEPFTSLYQRSQYQSLRNGVQRTFALLRARLASLPETAAAEASQLVERESEILELCRRIVGARFEGQRIRCHGDYHLGQVLYTGNDFAIIDFEGEPARSLSERRIKRSPLRDVAGMLRSFDYAAHFPLFTSTPEAGLRPEDVPRLEPWARLWRQWVSAAFLGGYLPHVRGAGLVPAEREPLELLLRVFLIEKSVYELGYELDNRPGWVRIPLRGIRDLLDAPNL